MYEFDSKLAYVSLETAQNFLGMQGEVTGIEVRTATPERAGDVACRHHGGLGPSYEVRSWEELNRGLFMALRLEKIAMFIVLTFIALVASFSIVSNLIMMVTEKGREVAILKSMGAPDGAILRVFFAEGLYIGLLGLAVGVTTGVVGCYLIRNFGLPLADGRLLHQPAAGGDARRRDRDGGRAGPGAVLPGDPLPGQPGLTHAAGRRAPLRMTKAHLPCNGPR